MIIFFASKHVGKIHLHDPLNVFSQALSGESDGVWDQGPGVALGLGFLEDDGEPFDEGVAILVISEDPTPFNSSGHYM